MAAGGPNLLAKIVVIDGDLTVNGQGSSVKQESAFSLGGGDPPVNGALRLTPPAEGALTPPPQDAEIAAMWGASGTASEAPPPAGPLTGETLTSDGGAVLHEVPSVQQQAGDRSEESADEGDDSQVSVGGHSGRLDL